MAGVKDRPAVDHKRTSGVRKTGQQISSSNSNMAEEPMNRMKGHQMDGQKRHKAQ